MTTAPTDSAITETADAVGIRSSALFGVAPYYQDAYVTLYHGSSVDMLPDDFAPESVVTDPPYGVGFQYESYHDTPENFDQVRKLLDRLAANAKQMALFMSMRQLWTMPKPKWMLCWAKPGSCRRSSIGGFSEWEPILLYGKGWKIANDLKILPDCANHSKDAAKDHPCPKPEKLMMWLVNHTTGVVCDPFAGSGTTLLAAKQLNRQAIGWEIEERYCEIIATRLAQGVLDFSSPNAEAHGRRSRTAASCSTFRISAKKIVVDSKTLL